MLLHAGGREKFIHNKSNEDNPWKKFLFSLSALVNQYTLGPQTIGRHLFSTDPDAEPDQYDCCVEVERERRALIDLTIALKSKSIPALVIIESNSFSFL